jgi:hypothetical protein
MPCPVATGEVCWVGVVATSRSPTRPTSRGSTIHG